MDLNFLVVGHTITLASSDGSHFEGLFNINNGSIKNLTIRANDNITLSDECGWICGPNTANGGTVKIYNCNAYCDHIGGPGIVSAGGIVGATATMTGGQLTIDNCQFYGHLRGINTGGIVGDGATNIVITLSTLSEQFRKGGMLHVRNCSACGPDGKTGIAASSGGIIGPFAMSTFVNSNVTCGTIMGGSIFVDGCSSRYNMVTRSGGIIGYGACAYDIKSPCLTSSPD